jgi:hypothetical protein
MNIHEPSRNMLARWERLCAHLEAQACIDLPRFERVTQALGEAARRLLVTCWERLGEPGFRAALRVCLALRREAEWVRGFWFPAEDAPLTLELSGPQGARRELRLAPATLQACATPLLRGSRVGALVA